MSLTIDEVKNIAHLARLELTSQDITGFSTALSNIMVMIDELNSVQTSVEPLAHSADDTTQRLRPDKVTETNQRPLLQSIAPQTDAGLYLVSKVIE